MAQRTLTEMTCDRCTLVDTAVEYRWGRLTFKRPDAGNEYKQDLCPDCWRAFESFWADGKKVLSVEGAAGFND